MRHKEDSPEHLRLSAPAEIARGRIGEVGASLVEMSHLLGLGAENQPQQMDYGFEPVSSAAQPEAQPVIDELAARRAANATAVAADDMTRGIPRDVNGESFRGELNVQEAA
jgi:hypothetical protein